jgi:hypothetical protein
MKTHTIQLLFIILITSITQLQSADTLYLYETDNTVHRIAVSDIDSLTFNDKVSQNTSANNVDTLFQFRSDSIILKIALSTIDSITFFSPDTKYDLVNNLKPVGYWPADEGEGDILNDRSGLNDGKIKHIDWDNGLLNYTSGFQWIEIPNPAIFQDTAFSVGGWLFDRRAHYNRDGMAFIGLGNPIRLWIPPVFFLRIRTEASIEVVSGKNADALGSVADKGTINIGQWQHILYTYDNGYGKLYINGNLAFSAENVPFDKPDPKHLLLIGNDASWWMLHPPESQSLDGSVRELVLFDRAVSEKELVELMDLTKPDAMPRVKNTADITLNGRLFTLEELSSLPDADIRIALEQLEKRSVDELRELETQLSRLLIEALDNPLTRLPAVALLTKTDTEQTKSILRDTALPKLIKTLTDDSLSRKAKAEAALALGKIGPDAQESVQLLIEILQDLLDKSGVYPPLVEDIVRNATLKALMSIDPDEPEVKNILSQALPSQGGVRFFSQGDPRRDARSWTPNGRAYTPTSSFNGYSYYIGTGEPWEGGTKIAQQEYEQIVEELSTDYPDVKDWRSSDYPHLYRVEITEITPDGDSVKVFLEGNRFVFDGSDAKVKGWSIGVDNDGYIHVIGGQHNSLRPDQYIPGSFEKIGISRDKESNNYPVAMYWVSEKPQSLDSLIFVGQRDNPRSKGIPGYFNYMNFTRDRNGELYIYGRMKQDGIQSWGLYHYDTSLRHWIAVGDYTVNIIEDAVEANPSWNDYLIRYIRGSVPSTATGNTPLVYARQPHFYNYCRGWGIQFDIQNRMHVYVPIRGLDNTSQIIDANVYAYSDDGGTTFHRANGKVIRLPLTVNPAPNHNADLNMASSRQWFDLWISLLRQSGFAVPDRF